MNDLPMTDIAEIFSVPIIATLALGMPSATRRSSNTTGPRILAHSSNIQTLAVSSTQGRERGPGRWRLVTRVVQKPRGGRVRGNAVDLSCLFQFPLPVGLPFIGRLFVDAGARRSLRLRLVVFDLANGVQQFLQDDHGFFGMCGGQQGGFAREAHESVLELRPDGTLRGFDRL